jgi:nucleoside 2-deoxyribosyltransferase
MNNKKYQVFVSSTYADLAEERKKILDVLLMADCIPAGMEAFVAADTEQFEVIKKVIDLCDYYVLIIGKRYGSIHPDTGKSYTEMEYDYAIEQGIPVLVFAIDENIELASDKVETDKSKIEKLKMFRTKAMTNRLASIWETPEDLTGKLAISIMKARTEIKRPGWQRAVDFDEASLRREIMEQKNENKKLADDLKAAREEISFLTEETDIAFEDCEVKIEYHYQSQSGLRAGSINARLQDLFIAIATEMMEVSIVEPLVERAIKVKFLYGKKESRLDDKQFVKKMLNQYRALNLVYSYWNNDNRELYWGLTNKGRKVRDDAILIRNN